MVMWLCHGCGQLVGMRLEANWVSDLLDLGVQLVDSTPAEFAAFLKKDRRDAELLIRIANQPREDYKPQ